MANALGRILLENLVKEAESLVGMNELQSLSPQLKLMITLLKSCDRFHHEHESVKQLVEEITDLAYDTEDVIDDYVYYFSGDRSRNSWKGYFPRYHKLSEMRTIGTRINNIKKKAQAIYDKGIDRRLGVKADGAGGRKAPIVEEANVVGFTNEAETLVKQLIGGDSKRAAISIIGMGGLGKTTLAKKIYNNFLVEVSFKPRAWVCVSQEVGVSREDTQKGIILSILTCFTEVTEEMKETNAEELGKELYGHLKGNTYLIVMDDIWERQVWEDLKTFFPDENNGSRILLTSHSKKLALDLCSNSEPNNPPHYLRFLDKEESWELFRSKAFPGEKCSRKWEELGRKCAEKCGGLPLAIVVLGSLLWEKRRAYNEGSRSGVTREQGIFDEWSSIGSRISTHLYEQSAECKDVAALSYNDLPSYMKPCFLYLSAFPEDYQIPARQVIQMWVSEGFIKENGEQTMEDTANEYLEMFADRGLIQVMQKRSDGGVKIFSIHCLCREFCISEAQRERLLQVHWFVNSPPQTDNHRRFAVNANTIKYTLTNVEKFSQLRSLLCFTHMSGTSKAWSLLFETTKSLKLFKMSSVSILPDEVENLIHLRYLGLDNNSLQQVPSSICNLLNLQVLDARSKFLHSVPPGIWNLKRLRHVYFEGPTFLPQPPASSSSLDYLQTLSTISADSCTSEVFQKLPNLRNLGVKVKGYLNALSKNFAILKHLRTLKLAGSADFPPLISLPLKFPPNLTKLTLTETKLEQDPMPLLGEIQSLEILKMSKNAYIGREIVCSAGGFPKLKLMKLLSLKYVWELVREEGALPKLEHLVIHNCHHLQKFTGLWHLPMLKVLDLLNPTNMLRWQTQRFTELHNYQLYIYPLRGDQDH